MKKGLLFILMFSIYLSGAAPGECWLRGKKEAAATKTSKEASVGKEISPAATAMTAESEVKSEVVSEPAPKISKAELEKTQAQREKKRLELNNTQWEIELVALNGKGDKQNDILTFKDNRFSSEEFLKLGLEASNYTLSFQEDLPVVETMQTSEGQGTSFWRIEFDTALVFCKGILSRQLGEGRTEDYSFVCIAKKPFVPAPPAVVSLPAAAAPETAEPKAGKK